MPISPIIVSCFAAAGGTAVTWAVPTDPAGRISHDGIVIWREGSDTAALLAPSATTWLDPEPAPFARYCLWTVGGPLAGFGTVACGCGGLTDSERPQWLPARELDAPRWAVFGPGCYDGFWFDGEDAARAWAQKRTETPADFNDSGAVDTSDLFDFLDAFFRGNTAAEWDGLRGVNGGDFFDFLGDFLRGA